MHFIFGGRNMGKLNYAKSFFVNPTICDLNTDSIDSMFRAEIIINIQEAVKKLLLGGAMPVTYFENNIEKLKGKILIGDEVGCGVVPIDAFEREWRDEVGRTYQLISRNADTVTRIWAGIPQIIKKSGV